jgi:vitamin B12/bleomycin/antimicrobial peptide transport system ATP-binding/permease protein
MVWDFYVPFGDLRDKPRVHQSTKNDALANNGKLEQQWEDEPPQKAEDDDDKSDPWCGRGFFSLCRGGHWCCGSRTPAPTTTTTTTTTSFGVQCQAFVSLAGPYYCQDDGTGRCYFFILLLLMILNSAVRVFFSYLARDFWSALAAGNQEEFYQVIRNFVICLLILAPITVLYRFQRQRLAIHWREWMTKRVLELYSSNRVYYSLERNMTMSKSSAATVAPFDAAAAAATTRAERTATGSSSTTTYNTFDHHQETLLKQERQGMQDSSTPPTTTATSRLATMDNPDQRIAEDVKSFTQYSLSLFLTLSVSLIDLVAFSVILYMIEPKLFVSIIAFAGIGTIVTVLIGNVLIYLNYERLHREADFRFSLVRIRENAESIAFFAGEDQEFGHQVHYRLAQVIANAKQIIGTQRNLDFFTTLYQYLTWIWPIVVVAPNYFEGSVEIGVVQQAAAAFGHVLEDMSVIITEFESLSEFSASIDRLSQFVSAIRDADPERDDSVPLMALKKTMFETTTTTKKSSSTDGLAVDEEDPITIYKSADEITRRPMIELCPMPPLTSHREVASISGSSSAPSPMALVLRNLTVLTPNLGRTLVRNLNLQLPWGQHLLIVGPSGVGKSSLLRAIAGLWTSGSGSIVRPHTRDVYFLPQKPYCPLGTLRDQLLYPYTASFSTTTGKDHEDDAPQQTNDNTIPSPTSNAGTATEQPQGPRDEQLLQILHDIDLEHLAFRAGNGNALAGLDATLDWSNVLSLGEQQRLAFGRVFLHQPRLVILDESTSAMDVVSETKMYTLLRHGRRQAAGSDVTVSATTTPSSGGMDDITYISVGHRPTLLSHHDIRLEIQTVDDFSVELIAPPAEG